MVVSRRVSA